MIGEDQPDPRPSILHRSFGPFRGQLGRRFFSSQIPSRRGPRHCGQPGSGDAINPSPVGEIASASVMVHNSKTIARQFNPILVLIAFMQPQP
jgi:hypothetical protein